MLRFLLDANLSSETAVFLRQQFSFDVASLLEQKHADLSDEEIVNLAITENRIIITLDLDFGELYHQKEMRPIFGVIILRLRDQRVERVNDTLRKFFQSLPEQKRFLDHPKALAVITETTVRILY